MKNGLLIALLVLLVVIVGVELFMMVSQPAAPQTPSQPASFTQPPSVTSPPMPTQMPVTAPPVTTPVPTAPPVTPAPTAPPTAPPTVPPTTPPTATPAPTAVPASDGSFQSSTGTNLNLVVSWRTENLGNGTTRVYVYGTVVSYSLDVMATGVTVSFGSYSARATGSAIDVDNSSQHQTSLFSTSLDVPSGTTGTMTVDWAFNGSYSGVSLPNVVASGEVTA